MNQVDKIDMFIFQLDWTSNETIAKFIMGKFTVTLSITFELSVIFYVE
jgi:hypothetical protein